MIRIQTQDFDVGAEIAALRSGRTDVGAVVSFTGTVRDQAGQEMGDVTEMTLEHYPGMTERAIARIAVRYPRFRPGARWGPSRCLTECTRRWPEGTAILFVAPDDLLSGLALYRLPVSLDDPDRLWPYLLIDLGVMVTSWLAARLALKC